MRRRRKIYGPMSEAKREAAAYLFFGFASTAVNWAVYILAVQLAGFSVPLGNSLAWVAAVTFAFVTNKMWVFRSRSWKRSLVLGEAGTFLGSRVATGIFEIASVPILFYIGLNAPLFGIQGFFAKAIVSVAVIVLNYVLSKKFVFRKR